MDNSRRQIPTPLPDAPDQHPLQKKPEYTEDYQKLYNSLILQNAEISVLNEELIAQQDELRLQYQQLAQAEYEIRKREEQLRFITRQIPATLWVVDRELNYLLSEGKGLSLIGLTPGEVVGQNLYDFFHSSKGNHPAIEAHIRALRGEEVTFEYDHNGVIFQTSLTPMTGPDQIINGVIGIAYDITEQVKAAERIRFERERAHQYLNVAEVMILAFDRHGTITLINRRGCEFLGLSHDDIIGKNWFDQFLPPSEWALTRQFFHEFFQGWYGDCSRFKGEILTSDGSPRFISWFMHAIRSPSGKCIGILASGKDITRERQLEDEKTAAVRQIEKNIAKLAVLNDQIRNPLSIILTLASMSDDVEFAEKISEQVAKIDSIVNDLDHRWMESDKVLEFLRKHHNFNTASITDGESK
ncbi:putative PAS/PAC sensor protein [Methanospirillum hungatei JF-1]|uniref:PAS/PAC sensor protein n=1 Tax=Methanospirillum hungatei JF-1 (strain ATCC 27890 / DSM 864 / NBRC 100397 / JF-1) TaxID=323259 RepID=Q2FR63_METHJ|nr:PAS domain S-box protein [Methanospirillum hungatei]ABD39787.1 putative PAS/PAC sensor protein [Methanospirillum hungatei JF-1]